MSISAKQKIIGNDIRNALLELKNMMNNTASPTLETCFDGSTTSGVQNNRGIKNITIYGTEYSTTSGYTRLDAPDPSPTSPTEKVSISALYQQIIDVINAYQNTCYMTSTWIHTSKGTNLSVSVKSGYVQIAEISNPVSIPTTPKKGEIIEAHTIIANINNLYNTWKDSIPISSNNVYTCHYVCYNQYSVRSRR